MPYNALNAHLDGSSSSSLGSVFQSHFEAVARVCRPRHPPDESWDVEPGGEELQVLGQLLVSVLCVHEAQLGEDAHVCPLQPDAALQQGNELIKVAAALVEVGHLGALRNTTAGCFNGSA